MKSLASALLLVGLGALVILPHYEPRPAAAVQEAKDQQPKQDDKVIVPHPRTPRAKTLDPAQFTDAETKKAYEIARDNPELLEHMSCYCGCMRAPENHTSNYDCFVDKHGAGCAHCRRIALDAYELYQRGLSYEAIKRELDTRYAR